MKLRRKQIAFALSLAGIFAITCNAQNIKVKNATSWEVTGRVQLQHAASNSIDGTASKTNNGFRIRRGRFQVKAKLSPYISTKFQIEARDNSPKLKDAEGKLKFGKSTYLRFGQFKVPVWREELRSSSKLMLVERSAVASELSDFKLSARHIGVELAGGNKDGFTFALNYSNGAGEGGREDAGRTKKTFTNNGKLLAGRVNLPLGPNFELGVSAASNSVGNSLADINATGTIKMVAPDFGIYIDSGDDSKIVIEGGFVKGKADAAVVETGDLDFTLMDVTAKFMKKMENANESFAGLDALEVAAGFSTVDSIEKYSVLRVGPAMYFGSKTRFQVNFEIENPESGDAITKFRSQMTFNF